MYYWPKYVKWRGWHKTSQNQWGFVPSLSSCEWEVVGRSILPSSSPTPLVPLLRPPIWNLEVGEFVDAGSEFSPSREKNPFFFGCFVSSFNPTSSKPSSAVGGWRSNRRSFIADRGSRGRRAESRLCRPISCWTIGDRAEMSYQVISIRRHSQSLAGMISQMIFCMSRRIREKSRMVQYQTRHWLSWSQSRKCSIVEAKSSFSLEVMAGRASTNYPYMYSLNLLANKLRYHWQLFSCH